MKKQLKRRVFTKLSRKKIIALGTIVLVILIAGLSWQVLHSRQQYYQQASQWKHQLQGSLQTTSAQLKQRSEDNAVIDTLNALHQTYQNATVPKPPAMLGISAISNDEAQVLQQAGEASNTLSNTLETTKQLIHYQLLTNDSLGPLNSKSSTNAEELKQLETTWNNALETLKTLSPPQDAINTHQQLVNLIEQLQADLAALVPLYENQEIDAFNSKKQAFLDKASQLKQISLAFDELFKQQDAKLSADIKALKSALQKLPQ
jgi:hypothetical protein